MKLKIALIIIGLIVSVALLIVIPVYNEYRRSVSEDPRVWRSQIEEFEKQDIQDGIPSNSILFVGSSSIKYWERMDRFINNRPVLNRGFGGAKISDVAFYLDQLVFKYKPKMVVIYLGVVDLAISDNKSVESVACDFNKLCQQIKRGMPEIKISVIALRPSPYRVGAWASYAQFNNRLMEMANADSNVYYIDANAVVKDKNGLLRKDIYRYDRQHLNEVGNSLWRTAIIESISKTIQ